MSISKGTDKRHNRRWQLFCLIAVLGLAAGTGAAIAEPDGANSASQAPPEVAQLLEVPAETEAIGPTAVAIYDADGSTGDRFGHAVGIDGDRIIVGAPRDDSAQAANRGSASMFVIGAGGIDQGKYVVNEADPIAASAAWWMGYDVAINGSSTVIGAPLRPIIVGGTSLKQQGMAIIVQWDGTAAESATFDHGFYFSEHYGYSVSLGDYAVGAPFASVFCEDITGCPPGEEWADLLGRVDVGTSDWLFPHDPQDDLEFGTDVARHSGLLAAVARGAVYAFADNGGWSEVQKLDGFDRDETLVVALDEGYLAVGQPAAVNPHGVATGIVTMYRWTGSTFQRHETLWPTDGVAGDRFGSSVAVEGTKVVIGAPDHGTGAAYVFVRDGEMWSDRHKLVRPAGDAADDFGAAVDISGDRVVVGAPLHDHTGSDSGAVYLFDLAAPPPTAATCAGLEATITGTDGPDELLGTAGNDVIAGLGGNDTIWGLEGDDVICGGGGDDLMFGGPGNDLIRGSRGDDESHGDAGNDRIQDGPGADTLLGGSGKDKLWGGIGTDTLEGDTGNDQLHGGRHDDLLYGGGGTDRMWGDSGEDFIRGGANSDFLYGGIDRDTLRGGDGNDRLFGWTGDDRLYGESGRDQLRGQAGDDIVDGGPHYDWCSIETVWIDCEKAL